MNQFANYLEYYTQRDLPFNQRSPKAKDVKKEWNFSPQFSPHRSRYNMNDIQLDNEPQSQRLTINSKIKYRNKLEDKENLINRQNVVLNQQMKKCQKLMSPRKEKKNSIDNSYLLPIDQILTISIQSSTDENIVQIDSVKKQSDNSIDNYQVQQFENDTYFNESVLKSFKKIKIQDDYSRDYNKQLKLEDDFEQINSFRQHIHTPRQQQMKNISFVMYKKQVEGRF
ncbi:unnamed protein product [Paramecium pentaurelia]|uniref:Uncharacterized protein n=1 Tax=Paramecium pentaurelia TaxID=43138 RepID=A0A8S1VGU2_9CILI|nr:unnamed protein product [Paramecium pentaurelia]